MERSDQMARGASGGVLCSGRREASKQGARSLKLSESVLTCLNVRYQVFAAGFSVTDKWSLSMKQLAFCLTLAGAMLSSAAHAQVAIDMSRVTCGEYLAMPPAQSASFSAWMSGWFNQKTGYVFVDLDAYARNVANVKSWCASNPTETVMAGLQRATAR